MSYTTSELLRMFADEHDRADTCWWKNFEIVKFDGIWAQPEYPSNLLTSVLTTPECVRPKPKTIIVNGVEVPEPIRNMPNEDEIVYGCLPQFNKIVKMKFEIVDIDRFMFLKNGYLHYDVESAKQHVAAINECNIEDVTVD